MPDQRVFAIRRQWRGARAVAAHVAAALFFGHAHAEGDALLVRDRHAAGVVIRRGGFVRPFTQRRHLLQHRHRRVGHGQRATTAGFRLIVQKAERRTRNVRTGARLCPRQSCDTVLDRGTHDLVIGRMKFDPVLPASIGVIGEQSRTIAVGIVGQVQQAATGKCAVLGKAAGKRFATFAEDGFAQRGIVVPEIMRAERRWLVVNTVGGESRVHTVALRCMTHDCRRIRPQCGQLRT